MNNQDLFNAINDIDEKFIADAGKYLSDDESDDPSHSEAVEIYPGVTRFSPVKLIAPIAAAAVLVAGVAVALKMSRRYFSIAPNAIISDPTDDDAGSAGAEYSVAVPPNDGIEPYELGTGGELPFELRGPDGVQIRYGEITGISGDVEKSELTESNWESITCGGFAYIAAPYGNNFNTIDNTPTDVDINSDKSLVHEFKRIYVGESFGNLTVKEASSSFKRDSMTNSRDESSDDNETYNVTALDRNYVKFDGEITTDVYIVNDGDRYYYFFRNGESQLPLVDYNVTSFVLNNEYETELERRHCDNGIEYAGELPALILEEKERAIIEPYLSNANYLKAHLTLGNITLESSQRVGYTSSNFSGDTKKIVFNYVEPVITDSNPSGETPFTAENEMQIRSILGSARTVAELNDNIEAIKLYAGCDNIKVFTDVTKEGGVFWNEVPDGKLAPGMYIRLYNGDELAASYKYKEAAITDT